MVLSNLYSDWSCAFDQTISGQFGQETSKNQFSLNHVKTKKKCNFI